MSALVRYAGSRDMGNPSLTQGDEDKRGSHTRIK